MKWTEDQFRAIATRNTNLLVSAAAGSGKTALLIERIRRMIMEEGSLFLGFWSSLLRGQPQQK